MIRRIILFLGLLLVAFFTYRRYNQPSADQLLYRIKTLSFNKSNTSNYSTIIDGKKVSNKALTGSNTTASGATLTPQVQDKVLISTGSTLVTGTTLEPESINLASVLIGQALSTTMIAIAQQTPDIASGKEESNLAMIDTTINSIVNSPDIVTTGNASGTKVSEKLQIDGGILPSTSNNTTTANSDTTNTTNITQEITSIKNDISQIKKDIANNAHTINTNNISTEQKKAPTSLSETDKQEAEEFMSLFK